MKVKVPSKIQVGGHWHEIVFDKEVREEGRAASASWRKQIISIDPTTTESRKAESLWHEMVHNISTTYMNDILKESDIDPLSEGLYQVFSQLGIELDWSEIKEV